MDFLNISYLVSQGSVEHASWVETWMILYNDGGPAWNTYKDSDGKEMVCIKDLCNIGIITHAPVYINDFRGVRASYMKETHRLKVNSNCDTALFISLYDITMAQP